VCNVCVLCVCAMCVCYVCVLCVCAMCVCYVCAAGARLGGELAGGGAMWFAVTRGTGVWVGARHVWPNAHADRHPDPSHPERMPERNAPSAAHERCACPKGGSVPPPWLTSDATDVQSIRTSTHAWPYGLFAPLALALEVDAVRRWSLSTTAQSHIGSHSPCHSPRPPT